MQVYDWDASLATGNREIDEQHRGIFELARRLHESCAECTAGSDEIANAVYGLSDYVTEHFEAEEEMMRAAGYPELSVHVGLHQALTGEVLRITTRYFSHEDVEPEALASFVAEWLRGHIREEDRCFVDFTK
jgi:hemerythrin-like metal-binding protein